jgi:hypothetical protein
MAYDSGLGKDGNAVEKTPKSAYYLRRSGRGSGRGVRFIVFILLLLHLAQLVLLLGNFGLQTEQL